MTNLGRTTYIEVTQGITGPVIDRFTIELDDDLDANERQRLINNEMHKRLEKREHYDKTKRHKA